MYFAMISSINNTKEKESMLYEDGYVEHVISSKVAISEMWSLAPFIISIYTKNIEGHKPRIKLYLLI